MLLKSVFIKILDFTNKNAFIEHRKQVESMNVLYKNILV
jgi:hypothetical protein